MPKINETPAVDAVRGSERHHRSDQRDGSEGISDLEYFQGEQPSRSIGALAAAFVADAIFRRLVESLCRRPRSAAEMLAELAAEYGLWSALIRKLVRYYSLPANALAVTGGDHFPPLPLYVAPPDGAPPMTGAIRRPRPRRP
jgi:hypothetical protein